MPAVSATALGAAPVRLSLEVRRGPGHWLRAYALMMRWEMLSLRLVLPVMMTVQVMIGAGLAIGLGLLIPDITTAQATYLASGGVVIPLLMIGLVFIPQVVGEQKLTGTYDFMFSLPVPRMAMYFAGLSVYSAIALPAAVAALLVASWRYDLSLEVHWSVVPSALLVVVTGSAIGYAYGHLVANPRLINLISQLLIFALTIFSPINFPAERLPVWLQQVHHFLPFEHAAHLVRSGLAEGLSQGSLERSWVTLGVWAVISLAATAWVITRRK
jgi:ABC-2 type transport system permease protein